MNRPGDFLFPLRGAVLAILFGLLLLFRLLADDPVRPAALLLVAAAAAWRLWAGRDIGPHSHGDRLDGPSLATGGAYAFGRHPLYASNMLAALGLVLFAACLPPWAAAALTGAVVLHHALLAGAEEAFLASRHGEDWRVYRQVTPRWLGLPRGGSGGSRGSWASALRRQGMHALKPPFAALALWGLSRL